MKKYLSILVIYFLLAGVHLVNAQTYPIPDINLRNRLISAYPTFMTANGELIIAAAQATTLDLNLDNANISNADGIQFFEKTGILRLRNNNLTSIPQLSFMKGVRRVYISNNQLTSFPDISALYQLADLYLINNKLTALPTIANKTTLEFLTCSNNQITELPDLSALTNLQSLIISYNPISVLPDLSKNISIKVLDIRNTNIHSIPALTSLTDLETFNCENNNFTDLSALNSNPALKVFTAHNNRLTSLPNFLNKPFLTSVNISNNNLTFEDLIPLKSLGTFSAFTYSPQKEVSLPLYVDIRESNTYTYQISIDPALTTNEYTWLKNTTPLLTNSTGSFSFSPAFMSDSGSYYAEITNTELTTLVLKTNLSKLTVRPCIEINKIKLSILSSDCREGSLIDIGGTTVDGAISPITYMLQSTSPVANIPGTTATQFSNIIPGTYILQATDSRNCTAIKSFLLDKGVDCESVFSPNGDGIMDNYFIADTGTIQIYNSSKKLIKTMNVPGVWDGTTNEGGLADAGYYVIIINGSSSIGVSLMR